jgi:predicted RNA binding protein YcfA (HicA-like mRNA interferase family)
MSRLPTLNAKKIIKALKKAGFIEHIQHGSHLILINTEKDLETCIPIHAGKDIKRELLKEILKQAGMSEEAFRDFL